MNHKLVFTEQMSANMEYILLFISIWVCSSTALPSQHLLDEGTDQGKDEATIILSDDYLPKSSYSAKTADDVRDSGDDTTVLISELSDQELMSLLKKNNKQFVDLIEDESSRKPLKKAKKNKNAKNHFSQNKNQGSDFGSAFFRLDDKEVEPFNVKVGADPNYLANQKIQNLLHSHPTQNHVDLSSEETEENKEILFDILTAQLKKLCCKSSKPKQKKITIPLFEPLLSIPEPHDKNESKDALQYEQMFLIINDEIKNAQGSEIIYVDPDSLNKNSSAILLGPITTPLSDSQLQVVMNRITSELSSPEYIPLLQELADGNFNSVNTRLVKSLVSGLNTRRYIKPHRCNQRYPNSQGPKWLICTGYLNINTPSIYD